MKKIVLSLAVVTALVFFSSCGGGGGGFEGDIKKMAEYGCKMQKLAVKAATDEAAKKEMEALSKEAEEFADKLKKKYPDAETNKDMQAKGEKIMADVMAGCK